MEISNETGKKFCELMEIITRLRAPGGCPWDQKQTVQTFKSFLLEETHELSEALDGQDTDQVKEELGDLFFQLGFINQLYEEKKYFSMEEVLQSIIDKMIRRHPHVFDGKTFSSETEMRRNWAKIKEQENLGKEKKAYALDVPKSLPALSRALRVASRAARTGFDWPDIQTMTEKLHEEFKELNQAIAQNDKHVVKKELSDMFLMLVNIGRKFEIDSEQSLQQGTNEFIRRFKVMEELIAEKNLSMTEINSKSRLHFWETAKNAKSISSDF